MQAPNKFFPDTYMNQDTFLEFLKCLRAPELMRAACVSREWHHQTNNVTLWRPFTAETGLQSDDVNDHKIIARLATFAPMWSSEQMGYDPKNPKSGEDLLTVIKLIAATFQCDLSQVVKLFIIISQKIAKAPQNFDAKDAIAFVPFMLRILAQFNMSFEAAANCVVILIEQGMTFQMGLLSDLDDLSGLKTLTTHCDNSVIAAIFLLSVRVGQHNSAWGADNPMQDFSAAINFLNKSFMSAQGEDYEQCCSGLNEIQITMTEMQPGLPFVDEDAEIIARMKKCAPLWFDEKTVLLNPQNPQSPLTLLNTMKSIKAKYKCSTNDVAKFFIMLNQIIENSEHHFDKMDITAFVPFILELLPQFDLSFSEAASLILAFYKEGMAFPMGVLSQLEDVSGLKTLAQHCDNDFFIAFFLIGVRVVHHNSAWGADNPMQDFIAAINFLNAGFASAEGKDYELCHTLVNEIRQAKTAVLSAGIINEASQPAPLAHL